MHIAVDLDNTLADTTTAGVAWLNRILEHDLALHDTPSYAFFQGFGLDEDMYLSLYLQDGEDLHWHTDPYPGAVETMQRLAASHRVSIVTARPDCFAAVSRRWLQHHDMPAHALHCERDKYAWCLENDVDLIVEDAPHYAREFAAKGRRLMLFDQPYNRHCRHDLIIRVQHWQQIRDHLGV